VVVPHESGLWLLRNPDAYSMDKGITAQVAGNDPEALMA
jgi:hypothetical protein